MFDTSLLGRRRLYMDGGLGTMLHSFGLPAGTAPESWNITHADILTNLHKSYFDAGSNIVCTNTFCINGLKYEPEVLKQLIAAAVRNVKVAAEASSSTGEKYVALDIGSLGRLLKPYGDLEFEDAVLLFAEVMKEGSRCGADLITIETMNDSLETKAAVIAAKENTCLPVFVSNTYGEDGKLMTGATPAVMASMLEGLGADAIGVNCSLGPVQLYGVVNELLEYCSVPVFAKPNAGLPESIGGTAHYNITAKEFAEQIAIMAKNGVSILGGCCGTDPEFIRAVVAATADIPAVFPEPKVRTVVSSYTHCVEIGKKPVIIGERINPTGKKRFKQALVDGDGDYILSEGVKQQKSGADILDVNVGLPGTDEKKLLVSTVSGLQSVTDLPLQIDTASAEAMEAALRVYNGKALLNSVNGKEESMRSLFPIVKKYGGVVVALTLDENGIPSTAEGRVAVAERILKVASEYGIRKNDIIFDTLCMAVSADEAAPSVTLEALRLIRERLGASTVLGISNVSFGLPGRDGINAGFLAAALEKGLSAAIVNPFSNDVMRAYRVYMLLNNFDPHGEKYIAFADSRSVVTEAPLLSTTDSCGDLGGAIENGLKERAAQLCTELLKDTPPLSVVNEKIIPALDRVGRGFEAKTVYLPQLLMSAEAAKAAFEEVKAAISASGKKPDSSGTVVIATVRGDIHDIGKNIVKVLLDNYGFRVIDLGKDVPPEKIADTVVQENAMMCGLSALMTTTLPAMEETVGLLHRMAPDCRIVVGGAVLTSEYAEKIGADRYAADAMETVRYAEKISGRQK